EVMPFLNARARITLSELTFNSPQILKNGVKCNATECIIESYANGVLKFTVLGFSTYTVEEGQQAVSPPPSDSGNTGSGDNGGGGGGGDTTIVKKNETTTDNREVDVVVYDNNEAEVLEIITIGGSEENANTVNVINGTRIVLEIEGSTEGHIVDFVVEEDHVKIISDGKSYDLSEDSATSIRVGDKDIYLGVRQFGLGNALVVFGVDEQSVTSEIFGGRMKAFTYILIGMTILLIVALGGLVYKYVKRVEY
ncbi:MAG: hypothetical protein Q7S27_01390, partial [Nanoarchaeota archaeon]|nr:hypothetical protein [Nanoarchaeota archaeon]